MRYLVLFLGLFFVVFSNFSQGDNCATAFSLGLLPSPAGCSGGATGLGAPVSHNGTNIGATSANPYVSIIDCGIGTADMASPAIDVWYSFVASGPTAVISFSNITGTFGTPQIGIYTGSCNNLTPIGCDVDGSPGSFTGIVPGQTYYVQVSGSTPTGTGNFTISIQNNQECGDCLQLSSLTVNPQPINGYYSLGQTVTFCYTVSTYNQINTNWFHGVQINYGAGWNMISQSPPAGCSTGSWVWKPTGIGTVNGVNWGPGFYFESNLGCNNCDPNDPSDNYGDANASNCDLQFCWTMQVDAACPASSLNVSVNTSGDGESGSWSSLSCQNDSQTSFDPNMSCCLAPSMSSTPTSCSNSPDGTATATATGTVSPWDFYWYDTNGTLVGSTQNTSSLNTISNLLAGTYTVVVVDNSNCSSGSTVVVSSSPGAAVTVPSNINVCNGAMVPASNFTSTGIPNASFTWTNSNTNIGLPASGVGSISSFVSVNTGTTSITSTIIVTPYNGPNPATSCAGAPNTYTITVNPSPQVTLSSVPGTTICAGQAVIISGSYTPQPLVVNQTFQNGTAINIPNGCSGPLGCQFGYSSVNSTNITPGNFTSGQLVSICFTLRHEDYTEFATLTLQVGSTIFTSSNPAPVGQTYNADLLSLLNQIKATVQTGGNNTSQTALFCIPQSILTLIENLGGSTNTLWKIGISDQTSGADNGSILDLSVVVKDYQLFNYQWSSTESSSIITTPTSGATNGGVLNISATPTATATYSLVISDETGCPGTASITINSVNNILPVFSQVGPFCQNAIPSVLPSISNNGISGVWSPSTINTSTIGSSSYIFTPVAGQCAVNDTMIIQVTTPVNPVFTQLGPYCQNATPDNLLTISSNGISGTWSPSIISTSALGTTVYTFTPTIGLCAAQQSMTVSITIPISPTFNQLGSYCQNSTPGLLPSQSLNGVSGTWNPAVISTSSVGTATYSFTPSVGSCANIQTMNIVTTLPITPTFSIYGPFCAGSSITGLPTISSNNINGTWSPSIDNLLTTTYTFTPTIGTCATSATTQIVINQPPNFGVVIGNNPSSCGLFDGTINLSGLIASSSYLFTYNSGNTVIGPLSISTSITGEYLLGGLNPGTYSNFIINDGNCSSALAGPIVLINPNAPVFNVAIGNNPTTCLGNDGSILLSGLLASTSYLITYNDGGVTITSQNISTNSNGELLLTGLNQGVYSNFVLELAGCIGTSNSIVNLIDPTSPNLQITNPPAVCSPETVDITSNFITAGSTGNGILTYWFDAAAMNSIASPGTIGTSGVYYIQSSINGCSDIEGVTVIINSTPNINNPGGQTNCGIYQLPSITGINLSGNENYYTGNPLIGGVVISNPITTSQNVFIYDANGSCSDLISFSVIIKPEPSLISFSGGSVYCQGDLINDLIVNVSGSSDFTLYYSLNGVAQPPIISSSSNINLGNTSGIYELDSLTDVFCINDSIFSSQTITINPIPDAPIAGEDTTYCNNATPIALSASGIGNFIWYDNANNVIGNSSTIFPSMNLGTTNYYVSQTVSNCEGPYTAITIIVEECGIIIPTAFTPDNDQTNDTWELTNIDQIYPKNKVVIYNRWGNVIFQSKEGEYETNSWDGKYNNITMPVGSYYYIIEFNDNFTENKTGIVTLIKN